eukprot:359219-Chlamydomonas_euryale.AAC.15
MCEHKAFEIWKRFGREADKGSKQRLHDVFARHDAQHRSVIKCAVVKLPPPQDDSPTCSCGRIPHSVHGAGGGQAQGGPCSYRNHHAPHPSGLKCRCKAAL